MFSTKKEITLLMIFLILKFRDGRILLIPNLHISKFKLRLRRNKTKPLAPKSIKETRKYSSLIPG